MRSVGYQTEPQRLEKPVLPREKKKRRQRGTDLLLFDLGFPRRTTLTLQRLNPSLEGRA